MRTPAPILVVLSLAACAHGAGKGDSIVRLGLSTTTESIETQREALIGKWFRNQATAERGLSQEIAEINRNGTYVFRFRMIDAAGAEGQWSEIGEWGIVGDIHFTITKGWLENDRFEPADQSLAKHYGVYRVLKLTADEFTYQHLVTKNRFTLKRVGDDFQFPK